MHKTGLSDGLGSVETLEPKCSPTVATAGGVLAAALIPAVHAATIDDDDPLPEPEPAPPPFPGGDPPIDYPIFPPSGPAGPGK